MPSSTRVAREILNLARAENRSVTPLELIKLTYLAHGWSLGLRGEALVSESAEAWQYGPVFPDLYHAIKRYRAAPVADVPRNGVELFGEEQVSEDEQSLIAAVYEAYKGLNGVQLSALTHQPGTPWDMAWKAPGRNTKIPNDAIQRHYQSLNAASP